MQNREDYIIVSHTHPRWSRKRETSTVQGPVEQWIPSTPRELHRLTITQEQNLAHNS